MNKYRLLLFLLLITTSLIAQQEYVDTPPTGKQNYLPYEGGSVLIVVDSTVSLDTLIRRLNTDWQLGFTGKGYWIGYTPNMFSIAARKDKAIQPLLNFIDSSSNLHARIGAIYCLHLIGIDRRIAGRFYEEFFNMEARKALLYSLKYSELQPTIMELLIRDPRLSDVPKIVDAMCNSNDNCWTLVNGLNRYELKNLPILQSVPDTVMNISVGLKYSKSNVIENDFDFEGQFHELLDSIKNLNNNYLIVEETLLHSNLWGKRKYKLANGWVRKKVQGVHIGKFLDEITKVDYLRLGNKLSYYVDSNRVFICSSETAKNKICDWWRTLPESEINYFNNNSPIFR